METFAVSRPFVEHIHYPRDRHDVLARLDPHRIDTPIKELITGFNTLPFCFTLQSCFGHFISRPGQDDRSLEPVPIEDCGPVRYRIAYIAFCLENSASGRAFHDSLGQTAASDPALVQFGSADWFWDQHVNSYALQVEPARYMQMDEAVLDHGEALRVQARRDLFYKDLAKLSIGFQNSPTTGVQN